jgi:hypothetical protein
MKVNKQFTPNPTKEFKQATKATKGQMDEQNIAT